MPCKLLVALLFLAGTFARGDSVPVATIYRLPPGTLQPVAVTDAEGNVHLVWLQGEPAACDVFYQRWPAGIPASTPPVRVNSQPGSAIAIGTVRGAHLAIGRGGRVHVVWNGSSKAETSPGDGAPLLYSRLSESGTAFEPARNLRGATAFLDGGASVGADNNGRVSVVWHAATKTVGVTEKDRSVLVARSIDDGTTFEPAAVINPEGGVCGCCGLRTLADRDGQLAVLYRAAGVPGQRPMILLNLSDPNGPARRVLSDPWPTDACPMSTGALIQGRNRLLAAWESEGHIRFTSITPGSTESPPVITVSGESRARHPALAVNARGTLLCAWAEGTGWQRGGDVAWCVLSEAGIPAGPVSRSSGLAVWSFPAAFPRPDGSFVVAY